MSFNSNPSRVEYVVNTKTTTFTFNFKIFEPENLVVYKIPSGTLPDDKTNKLLLNVDYTVSINGDLGGFITLLKTPTIHDIIIIQRTLSIDRVTDFVNNGGIYSDVLNNDQDYQTYLIVDNEIENARHLKLPVTAVGVSSTLPTPIPNRYMLWNPQGTALINDVNAPTWLTDAKGWAIHPKDELFTDSTGTIDYSSKHYALYTSGRLDKVQTNGETLDSNIDLLSTLDVQISNVGNHIDALITTSDNILDVNTTALNIDSINTTAANITDINTTTANITDINTNAANITDINTTALNIVDINTNALNIDSINTTAANIIDIQNAEENAIIATERSIIATTKATEASDSADYSELRRWESESFRLTAESYAVEPENIYVKIYTSNGNGTFTVTDTTDYSALHWEKKASGLVISGIIDDTVPSLNRTYSSSKINSELQTIEGDISNLDSNKLNKSGGTMTGAITAIRETQVSLGVSSAIDLSLGNLFTKSINSSTKFSVLNCLSSGTSNSFILELVNAGAFTITWFSGIKWAEGIAPILTASGIDVLGFYSYDGGVTWKGLVLGNDMK